MRAVIACACVAACAWSARAADLASRELDALLDLEVSGASKYSLRLSESPSSATVITAEQMRALGHRTLADVLRSVRGLVVSSDRTYTYLGVRGFSAPGDYNTRVLVLIDGNRVNDTVYDQGFLGSEFPLDLDLVERVEFIPGPGSAVHGGNAAFGTVNVVTRQPGIVNGAEAALRLGHGQAGQLRASAGTALGGDASLLVSATASHMAGTDAFYPGVGTSHRTDHERGSKLFAKLEAGELSATLIRGDRAKGLSDYHDTVFDDPGSRFRDTLTLADLTWRHRLDALSHTRLRLYGGAYSFRGDYVVDDGVPTLNRDAAQSRWWGLEGQAFTERVDAHKLVAGFDWQTSPRRDQTNDDIAPVPASYLDDRRETRARALYAEDQWSPTDTLAFTLGVRHDQRQGMGAQWSPRLAVVARPGDNVVLKFIHGSAFRPPNAYELYYAGAGYKGNVSLHSEHFTADELVLELRPTPSTRWTVSAYRNRMRDALVQNIDPADGLLVFRNVGALRAHGLEIEGERAWHDGAQLRANYSIHDLHDETGQALNLRNAKHVGKLVAVVPVRAGWTLGSETVIVGRRGEVAGYGVTNLTLAGHLARGRAHVSATVYDVFDRQGRDPGGDSALQSASPHDRRSLGLKLELSF